MFESDNRFLIIAAHPDDEVLGIGGIMSRAKASGIDVSVVFLGEGISARFNPEEFGNEAYLEANEIRKNGALRALKLLGVGDIVFCDNYCCRFDSLDILDLVKTIETHIQRVDPTHIFTHNPIEVNIDHRITYRAVETAVRPKPQGSLKCVYSFEIPCSGNWVFDEQFKPNCYVDIKDYWNDKIAAWNCYAGEERPFPFPRSDKGLQTMANFRGMQAGLEYAEGLKVLRQIV